MRIGQGFDAHKFIAGRPLILGGVTIPYEKGLEAHSDGDVLIHALCDALLGAAGLGDIGKHFPDTSAEFENIDSRILLRSVCAQLKNNKYKVANVDVTVVAQAPKLAPHINAMKEHLASDLELSGDCINIKATTSEGMGFTGRKEGIAAFAVALLEEA
jgi:2-C-methyl-D-erythritol 2,4-cyclodiphosphate synthase